MLRKHSSDQSGVALPELLTMKTEVKLPILWSKLCILTKFSPKMPGFVENWRFQKVQYQAGFAKKTPYNSTQFSQKILIRGK